MANLGVYNGVAAKPSGETLVRAPAATIEVRREDTGALAAIFSNEAGTLAITNPSAFADVNGNFRFYAAGLERGYRVTVTDGAFSLVLNNQAVGTKAQLDIDTPITTKGDIVVGNASGRQARKAVGTDFFDLAADSAQSDGLAYRKPVGAIASGRNIAARTNAVAPTTTIDITADELVVRSSAGGAIVLQSVSVSPAITASGVNGLDTGAEAANTWYYGWVIYNPTTLTVAGLISASATAPTMPSGYTYKALVTAARNDGSSNFVAYRQKGNWVDYEGYKNILSDGTAVGATAIDIGSVVPAIAEAFKINIRYFGGTSTAGGAITAVGKIEVVTGAAYRDATAQNLNAGNAQITLWPGGVMICPNLGLQLNYSTVLGAGTSPLMTIDMLGFKLPLGGE